MRVCLGRTADSGKQIILAYEDERGEDVIEAIDFWKSQRKSDVYYRGQSSPPTYSAGGGGGGREGSSRMGI